MSKDVASKWGDLVAERGFTQIPNYLMQINMFVHEDLKISPLETLVLFQLVSSWWEKNKMPYPSMRTISDRMGVSERQVQRAIKSLEKKEFLIKEKGKTKGVIPTNTYNLLPLVSILQIVAEHYTNKHPRNIKKPKGD